VLNGRPCVRPVRMAMEQSSSSWWLTDA
jgi:hypothetical protein